MEDFVTYEQAVQLKERGFDWECNHYYRLDASIHEQAKSDYFNFNQVTYLVSAPTLAQVVKWLYERGYFISVQYNEKIDKFQCVIYKQQFTQGYYCTDETWPILYLPDQDNLISYEPTRCLHKGINKVLELKKKKK